MNLSAPSNYTYSGTCPTWPLLIRQKGGLLGQVVSKNRAMRWWFISEMFKTIRREKLSRCFDCFHNIRCSTMGQEVGNDSSEITHKTSETVTCHSFHTRVTPMCCYDAQKTGVLGQVLWPILHNRGGLWSLWAGSLSVQVTYSENTMVVMEGGCLGHVVP